MISRIKKNEYSILVTKSFQFLLLYELRSAMFDYKFQMGVRNCDTL